MPVTCDRMEAKPISGECCSFCGNDAAPLVRMPCCNLLVCCDTSYVSYRGGGFCQFEHENSSICHFHYNEKHTGKWQDCGECRGFFGAVVFKHCVKDMLNMP